MKTNILFFLFFFITFNTQAQWVETGGPLGGYTWDIAKSNNNKLWVASDRALYVSVTNGNSWDIAVENTDHCSQVLASGDTIMAIYSVFVKNYINIPNDYFETYSIYSIDNGSTWSTPSFVISSPNSMSMLLDKIGNKFHLHEENGNDLETSNLGQTWGASTNFIPTNYIHDMLYNRNTAFHYETDGNSIPVLNEYRCVSFDAKATWAYIDSSGNGNLKAIGAIDSAIFFLADTLNPKMLRSTNLGVNMDTVFILPNAFPKHFKMRTNEDTLYLEIRDTSINNWTSRIYKSTDKGINWMAMGPNASAEFSYPFTEFQVLNTGEYIYENGNHIKKYSPLTDTSFIFDNSFKAQRIQKLVSSGNDLYCHNFYSIFRSSDDGTVWHDVTPPYNLFISDIAVKGDTVAMINYDSSYISYNKGYTWTTKAIPSNNSNVYIYRDLVILNYYGGIPSYSNDWGNTWTVCSFQGGIGTSTHCLINDHDTAFYDYVSDGIDAYLFKFNSISQQFDLLGNPNLPFSGGTLKITKENNVWFSYGQLSTLEYSNDGLNWNTSNTSPIPVSSYMYPYTGRPTYVNGIFYSHYDDTTFIYSTDMGASWNIAPGNNNLIFQKYLSSGDFEEFVVHKGILYLPTFFKSVWRRNDTMRVFSGNIYYDANNNSVKDINENNLQNIIAYTPNSFGSSNANGVYNIITDQTGDSLKVALPNIAFGSNPNHIITSLAQLNNNDFGLTAPNNISDFSIDATNVANFKPGFQTNISLDIENLGTLNQTSTVSFTLDTNLIYQSSVPAPSSTNGNVYTWNMTALPFTQHQSINIYVQTKVSAVIGDTIHCISSVSPANTDIYMTNNADTLNELVVGAYDPNDKTCNHGAFFTTTELSNGEDLEYVVRFQNTGNVATTFVNIEDTLSNMLDLSTFKLLNASHPMTYELKGQGIVKFILNPISLPPAVQNEAASHGFVKYSIKAKKDITVGNVINNTAYIYFDFNAPIITNTTQTEIVYPSQVLAIDDDINADIFKNSILIYPNPASNSFFINFNKLLTGNDNKFTLYDLNGRRIISQTLTQEVNNIQTDNVKNGIYIGTIVDSKNRTVSSFRIDIRK